MLIRFLKLKFFRCVSLAISYDVDYSIQLPENESNPSSQSEQANNLNKFVNFVQTKLEDAITLFDVIGDKNNDKSKEEREFPVTV